MTPPQHHPTKREEGQPSSPLGESTPVTITTPSHYNLSITHVTQEELEDIAWLLRPDTRITVTIDEPLTTKPIKGKDSFHYCPDCGEQWLIDPPVRHCNKWVIQRHREVQR